MTALTEHSPRESKGRVEIRSELLADDHEIFEGALVSSLSSDGYCYEAGDTASHTFAGIALEASFQCAADLISRKAALDIAPDACADLVEAVIVPAVEIDQNEFVLERFEDDLGRMRLVARLLCHVRSL